MAKLLLVGISYPHEMRSGIGHVACTLGGVNYESRGGKGCLKGSAARGATNPLFRHHFHLPLSDRQAARAKAFADKCVGQPYVWAGVPAPGRGGDCSGFVSAIICAAQGKRPRRLFATGSWRAVFRALGFAVGLGGGAITAAASAGVPGGVGVMDRPYPGAPIARDSRKRDHVKWIQARLNFAAGGKHAVLDGRPLDVDGDFGKETLKVVRAFQKSHGLQGLGMVGPKTWRRLNALR